MTPEDPKKAKQEPEKISVSVQAAEIAAAKPSDAFLRKGEVLDTIVAETRVKRADAKAMLEAF